LQGAQASETTAYLLNKAGVLPRLFEQRPSARKAYGFLDKRTDAMAVKSALDAPAAAVASEPAPAPVAEAPVEVLAVEPSENA
jgi:small subunit ribosomal protein S16